MPMRSAGRPRSTWSKVRATGPGMSSHRCSTAWRRSSRDSLSPIVLRLSSTIAAPPRARHDAPPPPVTGPAPGEPRRQRFAPARLAPVVAAASVAAVWLVLRPHTVDMAAHTFRAALFGQEGFTLWDGLLYGGAYPPADRAAVPPRASPPP